VTRLYRVRDFLTWATPFIVAIACGLGTVAAGVVIVSTLQVTEERDRLAADLRTLTEGNRQLLESEKVRQEAADTLAAESVARIEGLVQSMIAQHDENDHLRHISGHPKAPTVVTRPIAPPQPTSTGTTRPRTTPTTARRTTTTRRPTPAPAPPTTTCTTNAGGKCK